MTASLPVLPLKPRAGVCLHFSSLPSSYGIGDIGDSAQAFLQQLNRMGIHVWQFLPTGPTAYGDSPYQPLSAFAGNEMLIGFEPLLRAGLLQSEELQALTELNPASVDFGPLIPLKLALLAKAAGRFELQASAEMQAGYEQFLHENRESWLENYALYRTLKTLHGERSWPEWDKAWVRREPAALRKFRRDYREQIEQLQIMQFFFYRQWQDLLLAAEQCQIRLFGDMPIYIALDSADAWASPQLLRINGEGMATHVAGVPPDYFSENGQLWGNPLYDWPAHARDAYRWWIARMRHVCGMNHLVRVDHFRGFESYWAVPFGESTARNGAWQPGPRDALFLAMESALGNLNIVAENLGVITPEVEALRLRHQIPGMLVLQFEVNTPAFDPAQVPAQCVVYTGTHDNDTSVGWFSGAIKDTRTDAEIALTQKNALRLAGGSAMDFPANFIRLAFSTPACLAVVPMQDYLGLESSARMNVPGTTMNNWRWRLLPGALHPANQARIRRLVEDSGRG